jgi:plastocyanin
MAQWIAVGVVGLLVVGALTLLGLFATRDDSSTATKAFTYTVVVPEGTSRRISAGQHIELMPENVPLRVGDNLVVHNRDDQVAVVGPFSVRPGESLDYTFTSPGVFEGVCAVGDTTAHTVKIVVT